ncbi:MAG: cyclic nucleotide-binding protein [Rhodocyclaceae bacterium]|nr:cyclic nucleotide-binding protein [Rhodocyclaceae bacterium]
MTIWTKEKFSFQELQRIMFRLLERVDIFAGLTQQELLQILESAEKCTFAAGESILREGSTGSFVYIIIDGRVTVLKSAASGQSTELAQLEAGDSFGEMSLVDQELRSASVVALTPCVLLRLSENACWHDPTGSAKIFRNIARILSHRLRDMDDAFVLGRRR